MRDIRTERISRELFVSTAGGNLGVVEPWMMDRLTGILEEQEAAAGESIFRAGDAPDAFYFLLQGRVELARDGGSVAETLDGPRAFGMLEALAQRPRTSSASASGPVKLMRIRASAWFGLLEDSFPLAFMSVLALVRSVSALEEQRWAAGHWAPSPPLPIAEPGRRLDLVERLRLLRATAPLRGSGVQPLSDLASLTDEVELASGERLFERDGRRDRVFVLIDGSVEARKRTPQVTWRGGAGQMVCGVGALAGIGQEWEASALAPTRALTFRVDDWVDLMEENFELVRSTLATLALERERLVERT
jgi:CRP-like cAMP-binding protein